MLNRRRFLQNSTAAIAAGLFSSCDEDPPARRPNILLILSDQESERYGRDALSLPNRARIERRGVRFTRAFCTTPQCSASRASILTGLYPTETGVVTNVDANSMGVPLKTSTPNLGNVFQRAGYQTGYLGKWHLGNDGGGLDAFGFTGYRNLRGQELANAAVEWIGERGEAPWLLVVSFINPHDIYRFPAHLDAPIRPGVTPPHSGAETLQNAPEPQTRFLRGDQGKVSLHWDKETWLRYRSFYAGLIEEVDGHVGAILDALEAKGQRDDTVIVYSSDHGDLLGEHGLPFKGPCMYDELLNVPLSISYPRAMKRGPTECGAMTSLVDLAPSLAGAAGIEWPIAPPGVDLAALWRDPLGEIHDQIFAEYYGKQKWREPIRTIRTREYKYNVYLNGGEELYHLRTDPYETVNLANRTEYQSLIETLAKRLHAWRGRIGDREYGV
ncbi:MAG: sulfatase-like hydrolase/transferase [bacterium]|nr:sulfatase-like hydrolase/transferase [bacterium]